MTSLRKDGGGMWVLGTYSRSPSQVPFYRFFFGWEGSPTKIDYRKESGTLILTSLLEDPVFFLFFLSLKDNPKGSTHLGVHPHQLETI